MTALRSLSDWTDAELVVLEYDLDAECQRYGMAGTTLRALQLVRSVLAERDVVAATTVSRSIVHEKEA